MNKRFAIAAVLPAALALAACGSSQTINGQAAPASSGPGSSTGASSSATTSSAPSTSTSAPSTSASSSAGTDPSVLLTARLGHGLSQATTARLSLALLVGDQVVSGSGVEKLDKGRLVALDLTESFSGVSLRLIIVGGKTYAKLPSTVNKSGKPWQLVRATSSDPTVQGLAKTLASTQSSASLSNVVALISAARSVKQTGTGVSHGDPTTKYAVDVDPSKLPDGYEGKQAIVAAGLTSIPVNLIVDSEGRPVRVTENLAFAGQKVNVKISVDHYNKPVSIAAPPAGQVSTR